MGLKEVGQCEKKSADDSDRLRLKYRHRDESGPSRPATLKIATIRTKEQPHAVFCFSCRYRRNGCMHFSWINSLQGRSVLSPGTWVPSLSVEVSMNAIGFEILLGITSHNASLLELCVTVKLVVTVSVKVLTQVDLWARQHQGFELCSRYGFVLSCYGANLVTFRS